MNALRREAAASTCNRTGSPAPVEGTAEPFPEPVRVPQPDTIIEPVRSCAAGHRHNPSRSRGDTRWSRVLLPSSNIGSQTRATRPPNPGYEVRVVSRSS
ncbi:Uncharacterised protein [Mycobacteroides abscessus subsp. abscessus]|nr:Uncharacterised protein [Mycobacteroides abscessus subsp. abscessus]